MGRMAAPVAQLALLVLSAPALGGPGAPKTAIAGFAPYILGTETRDVLSLDPELATGNYPVWTNSLLTRKYGRSMVVAIGGVNHIATLGLQFWQGRLAVLILKWPTTAFDSMPAWRLAAVNFQRQIAGTYANNVVKRHTVISTSVWMMDLADSEGNELSAWSNGRPNEIAIVYLWAPYARALWSTPTPASNY